MGIGALKRDLREKIMSYQYASDQGDIWEILDTYDGYLEASGTKDERAEAAFLRGDVAFHLGRYYDAVDAFTQSLSIEKTAQYRYLEADAYNQLGMIFSYGGYETVALDNYLSAVDAARVNRNVMEEVFALLNIGVLYERLRDYDKAMGYYKGAYQAAEANYAEPELMLMLLGLVQQARLMCRMGHYGEARRMMREINSYNHVVAQDEILLPEKMLEVQMEEHYGTPEHLVELIGGVMDYLEADDEYIEQVDFYIDFATFLLEHGQRKGAREFLDALRERLAATEFIYLRMRLEELEIRYQERYCEEPDYLNACGRYLEVRQEYEHALRQFRQRNLETIEGLEELIRQKDEFEYRSKCDDVTGLLNKDTFQYEVEAYLSERNRNVMDAMLMIDIDGFKLVHDSFGKTLGDEVIKNLAELLRRNFGSNGILGRFGDDEFLVLDKNVSDMAEVELAAEEMREEFAEMSFGSDDGISCTISIGVSYNTNFSVSYRAMLSCADEALRKSKEYGKNRVTLYEIKRGMALL